MVNIVTIIYRVSYVSSDVGFQPSTVGVAFKYFFIFTPTWGNDPSWRAYFSDGLKPPTIEKNRKQLLTPVLCKPGTGARWTCPRKSGTLMQQLVQFGSWDLSGARGWWQFLKRRRQFCKLLQYPFHFHFPNSYCWAKIVSVVSFISRVLHCMRSQLKIFLLDAVGHQSTSSELHQHKRWF